MQEATRTLKLVRLSIISLSLIFSQGAVLAQKTFTVNGRAINVRELNKQIEALMDSVSTPGLSFAVIDQNKIAFYNTYGYKRIKKLSNGKIKKAGKINKRTIFEACSLSKTFFLFAVERLLDQGLFNLDTPLYHYLEYPRLAYDERYKTITGRMVLSHCSGIENWQDENDPSKLEILRDPGTQFTYSGEGYLYLSKVIENLIGKSTETYMNELVIEPLKLKRTYTTMVKNGHMRRNYCLGHTKFLDDWQKIRNDTPNIATWNVTTANDYAKLLINFFNSKYLSQKRLNDIVGVDTTVHYPMMEKDQYWGPGFGVNYERGDTLLFQGGDNIVFKGFVCYSTKRKSGFVFFSNGENGIGLARMLDSLTTAQHTFFNAPELYPNITYKIYSAYNRKGYLAALSYFKAIAAKNDSSISNTNLNDWANEFLRKEPQFSAEIALEYERRCPSCPEAIELHGKALMQMTKYEEAVADFQKAIRLDNASHTELDNLITECTGKIKKGN
jgi:CubicO group peptidase (beta-lactamase class C family)